MVAAGYPPPVHSREARPTSGGTVTTDQTFERTRGSLHAVAELLLAGPQYDAHRHLRLRVVDGGFATVLDPEIRLEIDHLVVGDRRVGVDGSTPAALGDALGLRPRPLDDVYSDGPDRDLDQPLTVDPAQAGRLVTALAAGDAALRMFDPGSDPVLWPEHFDVGIVVDEVNYGVSPGDGFEPEPYAYVGPWTPPEQDDFWNAPFGAVLRLAPDAGPDEVLAFLERGRTALPG
jgi:hypothetical protein